MHYACKKGNIKIIEILIDNNADVNVSNKKLIQPLHSVIISNNLDCFKFLINKLNPLDQSTKFKGLMEKRTFLNMTPILLSLYSKSLTIFKYLLQKSTLINGQDSEGRTILHTALERGMPEMVPLILGTRPNLQLRDKKGNTALMYAVRFGHFEMVKRLEKSGAELHTVNELQETVMHQAAKIDRRDMCGWFLDKGINPF